MVQVRRYSLPPRPGLHRARYLVLLVAIALGCSQGDTRGPLEERAKQYLDLKQRKQWEEVYDGYLDPKLKGSLSRDAFLRRRQLSFDVLSHTVTGVKENGDEGDVTVSGEANFPARQPGGKVRIIQRPFTVTDHWIKRDGAWYIVLSE
jgi:hypothetical protein